MQLSEFDFIVQKKRSAEFIAVQDVTLAMKYLFLENVLWRILNLSSALGLYLCFRIVTVGFSDCMTCWNDVPDIVVKFKI